MKLTALTVLLLCAQLIAAQTRYLSGNITDQNGEPLPYTNIIITGTAQGTSANFAGEYLLELPAGKHSISYQFIGYKKQIREIDLTDSDVKLDIMLEEETLNLREVVINSNGEDPAYEIIRQAQKKRRTYQQELKDYSHKTYVKIFAEADQAGFAMNLFGTSLLSSPGVFYLSEAVADIRVRGTDERAETLIASLVSGDTSSVSGNKARVLDFYKNRTLKANTVEYISPIANDAMTYYDYEFEGFFTENDQLINKIRLIPKKSYTPAFSGHIYIIEDSWRIYGIQAVASSKTNVIGDLELKVSYTQLESNKKWVPFSIDFYITSTNGIDAYYHAVQYDFDFDLTDDEKLPAGLRYQIADNQAIADPDYWKNNRPIPLTEAERMTYQNDRNTAKSTNNAGFSQNEDQTMSRDTTVNPSRFFSGLFTEQSYKLSDKWQFTTDPYLSHINFNTVEGLVIGHRGTFEHKSEQNQKTTVIPEIRYGFSSQSLYGQVAVSRELNLLKPSTISLSGGSFVKQISGFESIEPFDNTVYSLIEGENYQKLYQKNFIGISYQKEIFNGFDLSIASEYADRTPLTNNTDFSFVSDENINYTPNVVDIYKRSATFTPNSIWKSSVSLQFAIARPYNLYSDRKEILATDKPVIKVSFEAGMADSDYKMIWGNVADSWNLGIFGESNFSLSLGNFITNDILYITEYFHFAGNRTAFRNVAGNYGLTYQLLDYYLMSSSKSFTGFNYSHDFNRAILGKIPLVNKTRASLAINANYLSNNLSGNYFEAGIELRELFQFINIGYYQSYSNGSYVRDGLVIGASIEIGK